MDYKKKDNFQKSFDKQFNKLEKELIEVDEYFIKNPKSKFVKEKLFKLKKDSILLEIKIDQYELNKHLQEMYDMDDVISKAHTRLDTIRKNIEIIDDYLESIAQQRQQKSLDILTYINLIFLPLTLITGYFGMNFRAMGNPALSKGILAHSNAHSFVFALFFGSIMLFTLLYRYRNDIH